MQKNKLIIRERNIKAVALLPVLVENEVVGVMGFLQNDIHVWSKDEISIFYSSVNMIANAWETKFFNECQNRS